MSEPCPSLEIRGRMLPYHRTSTGPKSRFAPESRRTPLVTALGTPRFTPESRSAREPTPGPTDQQLGQVQAAAMGDFDVYDLVAQNRERERNVSSRKAVGRLQFSNAQPYDH
jgi:hypothetical protein